MLLQLPFFPGTLMQMGSGRGVTGTFRPINKLCAQCVKPFSRWLLVLLVGVNMPTIYYLGDFEGE